MGGPVPLGYRVENRKLLVDEAGAATVRRVFQGFAEIGSATKLLPLLHAEGLRRRPAAPSTRAPCTSCWSTAPFSARPCTGHVVPGRARRHCPTGTVGPCTRDHDREPAGARREAAPRLRCSAACCLGPTGGRCPPPTPERRGGSTATTSASRCCRAAPMTRHTAASQQAKSKALVMAQVRALLRQPEVIVGTWRAARVEGARPDRGRGPRRPRTARSRTSCSPANRSGSSGCWSSA